MFRRSGCGEAAQFSYHSGLWPAELVVGTALVLASGAGAFRRAQRPSFVSGCSEIFWNIQQCSGVHCETDFGGHLGDPKGAPKSSFRKQLWLFCCFKKARFSRCFETHHILLGPLKIRECCSAHGCNGLAVILNSKARGVLGFFFFKMWGLKGVFSQIVAPF